MVHFCESEFVPERSIGYLLRRSQQLCVLALEPIFTAKGLTGVQWSALVLICLGRSTTGAEIARDLSYDKGATTRLIDMLEERGWVTRSRCTADRRVVNLEATEAGRDLALRCKSEVVASWNGWLTEWSEDEVVTLMLLLRKLAATLETVGVGADA